MLRLGLTPSSTKFSFIDSHLMFFARQWLHINLPDCSCIYSNAYFFLRFMQQARNTQKRKSYWKKLQQRFCDQV